MRSSWKKIYLTNTTLVNLKFLVTKGNVFNVKPGEVITKYHLGNTWKLYNGFNFIFIKVSLDNINYKFGEFVKTKKTGIKIHMKK